MSVSCPRARAALGALRHSAVAAVLACSVVPSTFACSREASGQAAASPSEASRGQAPSPSEAAKSQASSSEVSGGQAAPSEASNDYTPSPTDGSPARPSGGGAAGRCVPWLDAAALVATSQSGRRSFFRTFEYDFATGALRVHDSDPFAAGAQARSPRVTDDKTTLSGVAKDRIERALFAVCPGPEALARRCAPGGCQRLVVTARNGSVTRVEDGPTVTAVMHELATLFPKLRTP